MKRPVKSHWLFLLVTLALSLPILSVSAAGAEEEPIDTVTFYFPNVAPPALDAVLEAINEKTRKEIQTEVQFNFVPWGDYWTKIRSLIAAGDEFEAYFDGDWGIGPNLAAQGALLELDDLVPANAPNLWAKTSKDEWDACRFNNKIVAIPWRWPKSGRYVAQIRQDLYEKYGLPEFDTVDGDVFSLDDYEKFMDAVLKNEPGLTPLQPTTPTLRWITPFAFLGGYAEINLSWNIAVRWNDPNMKLVDLEQTDHFKQMYRRMRQWYLKGYIPKDTLAQKEDFLNLMGAGKAASILHVFDSETTWNKMWKVSHPDWKAKAYLISVDKIAMRSPPLNNAIWLNVNGAHPEKAIKFWEWVHLNQDNYDLFMYGIKGVHWFEKDKKAALPQGLDESSSPYMGWHGRWAGYWPEYERLMGDDEPDWFERVFKAATVNDKFNPTLGWVPDLTPIKNELALRDSIRGEHGVKLEVGAVDPDQFLPEYIAKQKAAGVDKILAELQKQLDTWKAGK